MNLEFRDNHARAKTRLLLATSLTAPLLLMYPGAAGAADQSQPAAKASSDQLEEIVVTARYRAENVQQTPIAITAVTGDQLEERGANNLLDVAKDAPSVTMYQNQGGDGKAASIFIRGVGQSDFDFALDPGVAVYIDDVYFGTVFGNVFDLTDIDRVEVLNGPQGTLFGKNSIGGAVRVFTAQAKGDDSGYVEAGYGSYNREYFRGAFDVPVVADKLFLRIGVGSNDVDGYQDRIDFACAHPGQAGNIKPTTTSAGCKVGTLGGDDTKALRADVKWLASDSFQVNISADLLDDKGEPTPNTLVAIVPNYPVVGSSVPALLAGYNQLAKAFYGIPVDGRFLPPNPFVSYASFADATTGASMPFVNNVYSWGFAGTVDWDITSDIHFKNIASYRKYDGEFASQDPPIPIAMNNNYNLVDHHQFSEEADFSGKLLDNSLEWTAGAYYYIGYSWNGGEIDIPGIATGPFFGLRFNLADPVEEHNTSGFLHALYHVDDQLSIEAGVRYTSEDKTYTFYRRLLPDNPVNPIFSSPIFNPTYPYLTGFFPDPTSTSRDARFDPKIDVQYQWTPDLMSYAEISTGFKGGGINPRPTFATDVIPFKPEDLTAVEVGTKSQWLDHRLRLNADAYVSDYKNLQTTTLYHAGTIVTNAGHVIIDGLEGQIDAQPLPGLLINANISYLHYETLTLGSAAGVPGGPLPGAKPAGIPAWKYNIGAQYAVDMGEVGFLTPRLDWTYQSTVFFDSQNNPVGFPELGGQSGYGLLNARLTYDSPDADWEAALEVSNALDQFYWVNKFNLLSNFNVVDGQPGMPRTFLLTIKRSFAPPSAPAPYAPPPAPAPSAAVAPQPVAVAPEAQRSFQVFFDFDKSDITDAASRVIQAAADAVRQGKAVRITVTGHTDTVGTARYNQALSERRAAAVKGQLVSDGVGAGEITATGVGKTGLLVPTADGVREPQNRRAEIVLQ